jgi:hypothetical protein
MPHWIEITYATSMFVVEALAADAIVEMMKHGARHVSFWIAVKREAILVKDEVIELAEEEIEIIGHAIERPQLVQVDINDE